MAFPNEVTVSGTLANVEMKQAQSGNFYLTAGLKVWQGKDKDPAWIDIVVFNNERNQLADYIGDSFGNGINSLPVIVRGKLEQNTWEDKDTGQKRKAYKIIADEVGVSFVFGPVGIKQDQIPERQVEAPTYSTKDNDAPPF
jgi:single-stranded DNA-binding protein|tara:strand:- start:155 stop:577 length:423 start_codon:yes stop_codon:yes gene_type:complete